MSLESIEKALISLGYQNILGKGYIDDPTNPRLTVARKIIYNDPEFIKLGLEGVNTIETKDRFCDIYIEGTQIVVDKYGPQISEYIYFDTESQVIAYIKKEYPL